MPSTRQTLEVFGFATACLLAGWFALVVFLAVAMFQPLALVVIGAAFLLFTGSTLCAFAAVRIPSLWILWPLLFGGPMAWFGMNAGFSPPDPGGLFLWRSVAVAFAVVPALAAFGVYMQEKRLVSKQA